MNKRNINPILLHVGGGKASADFVIAYIFRDNLMIELYFTVMGTIIFSLVIFGTLRYFDII